MALEKKTICPTFTHWQRWTECFSIPQIDLPGVYAIAVSDVDISGSGFSIRLEIRYFGMTVSKGGLASRLSQFHGALFFYFFLKKNALPIAQTKKTPYLCTALRKKAKRSGSSVG